MKHPIPKAVSAYLAIIGAEGGRNGRGAAKRRVVTRKMARKAAMARWGKRKEKR